LGEITELLQNVSIKIIELKARDKCQNPQFIHSADMRKVTWIYLPGWSIVKGEVLVVKRIFVTEVPRKKIDMFGGAERSRARKTPVVQKHGLRSENRPSPALPEAKAIVHVVVINRKCSLIEAADPIPGLF
jgi:hypothetical protein